MNPSPKPKTQIPSSRLSHCSLFICLLAYLAVAVLYGATIPIFETPDANGHYAYIHELTEGRGLPVQGTPSGERVTGYVASHPPLYYTLCAALTFWNGEDVDRLDWVWRNPYHAMGYPGSVANKNYLIHTPAEQFPWRGTPLTMHIARLVSTALGTLAVVATYGITLELFPNRRWLALGAASLTAFNPMFIFTAARVSNDGAVAAFGSLVVWGAVRLAVRGLSRRGLALTGVALGLAMLSKLSGITLVPVVALALLLNALRNMQETRLFSKTWFLSIRKEWLIRLLVDALITFGVAGLVCGWWFGRNLFLYGELIGTHAWLSRTATVRPESIGLLDVIPELHGLEVSYWAMFGWFNVPVAPWMYRFWWVLVRAGVLGLVFVLVDQWRARRVSRSAWPVQAGLMVLACAFLLVFGSVWRFIMIVLGSQGRYLMPAVTAISVFLMLGLSRLLPRRWTPGLAVLLSGTHLTLALVCLFAFILPAYVTPEVVQENDLPEEMAHFDLTFEGTPIQLLGGSIEADGVFPGEPVPVSLYWRALEPPQEDFVAFVQVLGRDAEPIAGVDCYPGRGNFPPTLWQPGVIYRDRYVLPLAAGAQAPAVAALHAGLYPQGGDSLVTTLPSGELAPDLMLLDLAPLRPVEPLSEEVAFPVGARLDPDLTLVGYDLFAEDIRPGETFTVTLVWRAETTPAADYVVFVHLVDESGTLVAQADHHPLEGAYRTSFWAPGDVVRDSYRLTVSDAVPSCACTLLVGMYDQITGSRIPAYDGLGTRFEGDAIVAGGVILR
ncbi:MAG: glycosyltransferase family 39 protein [Chloroflexota bacterium]|nr:glycosyltransferase family 39 protein [Chloroflexota bacterium]